MQAGQVDRRIRLQGLLTEVVAGDQCAALTALRPFGGVGLGGLQRQFVRFLRLV